MRFYQLILVMIFIIISTQAQSHGYIGKRFFPSAITIDEPFVTDKLVVPIYYSESSADGETWTTNPKLQYAKSITPHLQASINSSYLHIESEDERIKNGFDNWEVGVRYNFLRDPKTEVAFSIGLNATLGGSGSHIVSADSFSTISPELLFAEGFGILPESLKYLRPLGFTASFSPNFTTENNSVSSLSWGAAIGYSLPYLQAYVENLHITLFDHVVPMIELPFNTCTSGSRRGQITGNIDPGFIFYNTYGQLGIEAIIPANHRTGNKIGGVIQFYLYLDRIFPSSIGKPIFA
ncbi:MAG TPA: hypothetical protein VHM20_02330 [Gammaproteobacteria bacterium]|jgi:hypothetical protein|nr:hypothetical protein [Gammaproteobacteria bacterium]